MPAATSSAHSVPPLLAELVRTNYMHYFTKLQLHMRSLPFVMVVGAVAGTANYIHFALRVAAR